MPDIEKRYRAYKLLRELDSLTSSTMKEVAYGRLGGAGWKAACEAHRAAFERWIAYAESVDTPEEAEAFQSGARARDRLAVRPLSK